MPERSRLSVTSCRYDPCACGAQRGPNRELLLPGCRAGEQQVGDVRARDQQDEADRAKQHEYRRLRVAEHLIAQRHEGDPGRVRGSALRCQHHPGEIGCRLLCRHARREARIHVQGVR